MTLLPFAVELDAAEMKAQRAKGRAASLSKKRAEYNRRSSSVHFAAECDEELSSPCRPRGGCRRGGKAALASAGHGRAASEAPPSAGSRAASLNPHRAARAAMRTCLKRGAMESASDVPSISRGKPGRKASISPLLVSQKASPKFEADLGDEKFCLNSEDDAVTTEAADSAEYLTSDEEVQEVDEQFEEEEAQLEEEEAKAEDEETTKSDKDDSRTEAEMRANTQAEIEAEKAIAEVDAMESVALLLQDTKRQAAAELEAMREKAEEEARQIKRRAVVQAVAVHARAEAAVKARAEADARAKEEADAARGRAEEEERQRLALEAEKQAQAEQRKAAATAKKQAKAMEQQRAKQFRREADRARHLEMQKEKELAAAREQAAQELANAQREAALTKAEACAVQARLREEIRAKARAEAEAAKKQAEAEAQTIRAKAEAEAKELQEQAQANLRAAQEAAAAAASAAAAGGARSVAPSKGRQSAAVSSELIENEEVEADWEVLQQKSIANEEADGAGQWEMVM